MEKNITFCEVSKHFCIISFWKLSLGNFHWRVDQCIKGWQADYFNSC